MFINMLLCMLLARNAWVIPGQCLGLLSSSPASAVLAELPDYIEDYRARNHPETTVAFWVESSVNGCVFSGEDTALPVASMIKTFILVSAYLEFREDWDEVPPELNAVLSYEEGYREPLEVFGSSARQEVRNRLGNMTYGDLARSMMGRNQAEIGNNAYNAAANVLIFMLGGPRECTERIRSIHSDFNSVRVGRYMLASRTNENENQATVRSLATVCRIICSQQIPGLEAVDYQRITSCMQRVTVSGHNCYQKHGHLSEATSVNAWMGWIEMGDEYGIYCVNVNTWERKHHFDEGADHYCEYIRRCLIDLQ
jgi:hypothetical protein